MTASLNGMIFKGTTALKTHYFLILLSALLLVPILTVYGSDLQALANEALQSQDLSHILLVPFLEGVLLYLKRDTLKASLAFGKMRKRNKGQYLDEVIGIAMCLIAFLLYWYGSYTFYPLEYHIFSLPIFLAGLTLILSNFKTLIVLIFPILLLLFLVPPPAEFMYVLGGVMGNINTQAAYTILRTAGLPVILSTANGPPTLLLTTAAGQPASFTIDLPCSGVYTLVAFAMFATFLLLITMSSFPKKIATALLGFFVFTILNIVRITLIISVAYWLGEEIAMVLFHTVAGIVLIFFGMLFTLFISEKLLKVRILPISQERQPCPKCETNYEKQDFCSNCGSLLRIPRIQFSKMTFAKIALLIIGCSLVTLSINAPTFAIAQGPMGMTATSRWENATSVLPQVQNYSLAYLYRDVRYEKIARQDASHWYAYFPANNSKPLIYVSIGVASSISNLHNWEVCLASMQIAQGQYSLAEVLDSREIQPLKDVPLIARYFTFISPDNYTQVTLYWYEKATVNTGITVEQKYVRINLLVLTESSTRYKEHEEELLIIGKLVAAYWEPLKIQSIISLGVPAQQFLLAASVAFVAFTKVTQHSGEWRKKNNNMRLFNSLGTKEEKAVLQTVLELTKEKKHVITAEISTALQKNSELSAEPDFLNRILARFEEYGFIRKDVTTIDGNPALVWKV